MRKFFLLVAALVLCILVSIPVMAAEIGGWKIDNSISKIDGTGSVTIAHSSTKGDVVVAIGCGAQDKTSITWVIGFASQETMVAGDVLIKFDQDKPKKFKAEVDKTTKNMFTLPFSKNFLFSIANKEEMIIRYNTTEGTNEVEFSITGVNAALQQVLAVCKPLSNEVE